MLTRRRRRTERRTEALFAGCSSMCEREGRERETSERGMREGETEEERLEFPECDGGALSLFLPLSPASLLQ